MWTADTVPAAEQPGIRHARAATVMERSARTAFIIWTVPAAAVYRTAAECAQPATEPEHATSAMEILIPISQVIQTLQEPMSIVPAATAQISANSAAAQDGNNSRFINRFSEKGGVSQNHRIR